MRHLIVVAATVGVAACGAFIGWLTSLEDR